MNRRGHLLIVLLAGLTGLAAATTHAAPTVAGHFVVHGLARLGDRVTLLYRALDFGPALVDAARIRERLAFDLGLAGPEGIDPRAPLGAVWVDDGATLQRVPFVHAADAPALRAGLPSAVRLVPVGEGGGLVLAPSEAVGRLVADYLVRSGLDVAAAGAVLSFRFVAAPFVARGDAWLGLRADMLRGVDRFASLLGDGREDLRRIAEAIDGVRGLLAPWELFDGDVDLDAGGLRFRGRMMARDGTEAAEWLARTAPLVAVPAQERDDVAVRFEWAGAPRTATSWLELVRAAVGDGSSLDLRETSSGVRGVVAREGASLTAERGDGAGALVRCSVAVDALIGVGDGGAPVHLYARVIDGGALGVEFTAPIGQLRACVPRIDER